MSVGKSETKIESRLRRLDASDESQYMINENYEVYEKAGCALGSHKLSLSQFL